MKEIIHNGVKLYYPERYHQPKLIKKFSDNYYEKEESGIVKKYFNKEDIVLELGSCLGYVTTLLSRNTKKVISVEANPELKESLEKCKEKNKMDNVEFIFRYLSPINGSIVFQTYNNVVAGSGDREDMEINNVRGEGHTLIEYNVDTIDLYQIKNIASVNSLVIDIEGGELIFLQNYGEFLMQIDKICIELHEHLMKDKNFNKKCMDIIIKCGFKLIINNGCTYFFKR